MRFTSEVTTYTACGIVAMKTHPNSSEEEFQLVVAVPPVSISSGLNLKSISGVLKVVLIFYVPIFYSNRCGAFVGNGFIEFYRTL